ncbi:MAG: hypothetical protein QGF09_05805, partial [Rhodospirillales bacterium]|nr:hypothetical protein [Rhodospirillales bacterium]
MVTKATSRAKPGKSKQPLKSKVGGVRSERPFRIRKLQHFALDVTKMNACHAFCRDLLGFATSDILPIGEVLGLKAKDVGAHVWTAPFWQGVNLML